MKRPEKLQPIPTQRFASPLTSTICNHQRDCSKYFGIQVSPLQYKPVSGALREKGNELIVEVANLMANRIAYMDRQKMPWQKFFFVNIRYQPFSAADWEPLPSGLLGPVKLTPFKSAHK
jgi:hypothetical protein